MSGPLGRRFFGPVLRGLRYLWRSDTFVSRQAIGSTWKIKMMSQKTQVSSRSYTIFCSTVVGIVIRALVCRIFVRLNTTNRLSMYSITYYNLCRIITMKIVFAIANQKWEMRWAVTHLIGCDGRLGEETVGLFVFAVTFVRFAVRIPVQHIGNEWNNRLTQRQTYWRSDTGPILWWYCRRDACPPNTSPRSCIFDVPVGTGSPAKTWRELTGEWVVSGQWDWRRSLRVSWPGRSARPECRSAMPCLLLTPLSPHVSTVNKQRVRHHWITHHRWWLTRLAETLHHQPQDSRAIT